MTVRPSSDASPFFLKDSRSPFTDVGHHFPDLERPLTDRVSHPGYPRSNGYDARWTVENQMGPHALWLLEWLARPWGSTP